MNNNTIGVIVVGLLGFLAIIVTGKWLLDSHHEKCRVQAQAVVPVAPPPAKTGPQPQTPPPAAPPSKNVDVNVNINGPRPYYPQYHNCDEFWFGYRDGYCGRPPRPGCCPEYMHGYRVGCWDRHRGCHDYFDRHCPPGFSIRTPGFRLDIR